MTLDGANDNVIRNPISGISGTAISTDLWLKTVEHDQGSRDRLVRDRRPDRRVPAARPARVGRVREGHLRLHRRHAQRRVVAPPRGDVDLGRRCTAGLQGRRARVLGHGAGRRVDHRGRRTGAGPGPGLPGRWVLDRAGVPGPARRRRDLPHRAHARPGCRPTARPGIAGGTPGTTCADIVDANTCELLARSSPTRAPRCGCRSPRRTAGGSTDRGVGRGRVR